MLMFAFNCQPPIKRSRPREAFAGILPAFAERQVPNAGEAETMTHIEIGTRLIKFGSSGLEKPQVFGPVPPVQKFPGELSIECDQT